MSFLRVYVLLMERFEGGALLKGESSGLMD